MRFDVRRLTPALVTSLALLFLALLCANAGWMVLAWLLGVLGLGLNVVGVTITQIEPTASSGRRAAVRSGRRAAVGTERDAGDHVAQPGESVREPREAQEPGPQEDR